MQPRKSAMLGPLMDERVFPTLVDESECKAGQDILRYLFKRMTKVERKRFDSHCGRCPECQAKLEGTQRGIEAFFDEDE